MGISPNNIALLLFADLRAGVVNLEGEVSMQHHTWNLILCIILKTYKLSITSFKIVRIAESSAIFRSFVCDH